MEKQRDLLQGTLDMPILKAVSLGPLHGYGILLRIQQISKDQLDIQQGSLYPALYRLEHRGRIAREWAESENKRKAKYYRLTATGKRRLQTEAEKWNRMADVIAGILGTTRGGAHGGKRYCKNEPMKMWPNNRILDLFRPGAFRPGYVRPRGRISS
jgi:PadR family transcriptional regulator PadR